MGTQIQAFSIYCYLTVFCSWDPITGLIPHSFDLAGFSNFVQGLAQDGSFLYRARLFIMESTMQALLQDRKKLVASAMYCSLNADRRIGNRFTGTPEFNNNNNNNSDDADVDNDKTTAQADVEATCLLDIIQAEARQDDTTVLAMLAEE
jgi:hypothetical protein